jgi:hypothetical protein
VRFDYASGAASSADYDDNARASPDVHSATLN